MIVYLMFYLSVYRKKQKIMDLLNLINTSTLLRETPRNTKLIRYFALATQFAWLLVVAGETFVGYEFICSYDWSRKHVFDAYVVYGRYTFFISGQDPFSYPIMEALSLTTLDKFVGVTQIVATASHLVVSYFCVTLFGTFTIILWEVAKAFQELVVRLNFDDTSASTNNDVEIGDADGVPERNVRLDDNSFEMITAGFVELDTVSSCLNRIWDVFNFTYILDIIAWLSTELDKGLQTRDWFARIDKFYFYIYFGITLLLSAETFRMVN